MSVSALLVDDAVPADLATGAPFDISEDELDRAPHDYVAWLRDRTPVWCRHYGPKALDLKLYTVFPYDLALNVFKHPNTRQFENEIIAARGVTEGPLLELYSNGMLASN